MLKFCVVLKFLREIRFVPCSGCKLADIGEARRVSEGKTRHDSVVPIETAYVSSSHVELSRALQRRRREVRWRDRGEGNGSVKLDN